MGLPVAELPLGVQEIGPPLSLVGTVCLTTYGVRLNLLRNELAHTLRGVLPECIIHPTP